jgi:hypothetical protein
MPLRVLRVAPVDSLEIIAAGRVRIQVNGLDNSGVPPKPCISAIHMMSFPENAETVINVLTTWRSGGGAGAQWRGPRVKGPKEE